MPPDSRYQCNSPVPCRRQDNLSPRYCLNCEDLQLTEKEKEAREFIARELKIYNETPFPNGAAILYPGIEGSHPVNASKWLREVA
ncbi:hypothetical protein [Methanoregula sp.]|uniref:hypothetical protein n=1 Tax=Methanoregula sp. TaxID=2052170 RepID=UPI000CA72E28|nr:hypothetical protein [Methanoregula sp.]PKG31438.1 MAG: hypothetical protein CW742_13405 [Methanoregula sp.]